MLSSLVFLTHFPNVNSCPQRRMKRVAPTHMLHATAAGAYNGCGSGEWTPPPVAGSVSVVAQVLGGVGFAGAMEVGPRTAPGVTRYSSPQSASGASSSAVVNCVPQTAEAAPSVLRSRTVLSAASPSA